MVNKKGFTLIEIVIVIALIALLSVIGMSSFNRVQTQSRTTKINTELKIIQKNINAARFASNQNLGQITGNFCSVCTVCTSIDLRNIPDTHDCVLRWRNLQNRLSTWNGDISDIDRDPWGSPYVLDENDGAPSNPCTQDVISSVGPDGIYATADDISIQLSITSPGC